MALKNTLNRRKAKGHAEAARSTLTKELRTAIAFDLERMFHAFENGISFERMNEIVHTLHMDIIQHVFNGSPPGGRIGSILSGRAAAVTSMAYITRYLEDAKDDLSALDTIALTLHCFAGMANAIKSHIKGEITANYNFIWKAWGTIDIVNERLIDHNIGYQFDGTTFVRSPEPELFKGTMEPCLLALHREEKFRDTEREFRKALDAWKKKDYKQAVHHSAEALEGMLRVLVKEILPAKHSASLQTNASVDILNQKKLWAPQHGEIMKKLHALRGDRGAHSEATKPEEGRATEKDAEATVYLSASMLVLIARAYEDHLRTTSSTS